MCEKRGRVGGGSDCCPKHSQARKCENNNLEICSFSLPNGHKYVILNKVLVLKLYFQNVRLCGSGEKFFVLLSECVTGRRGMAQTVAQTLTGQKQFPALRKMKRENVKIMCVKISRKCFSVACC